MNEKLAILESKLDIKLVHFTGNCKEEDEKGIPDMMGEIIEQLYAKNIKEQSKIEEDLRISR